MTASAPGSDTALVLSVAAVWKCYFDQQSTGLASAMRPWEISPGPSRLWEPLRDAAALGIARFLTDVAGGPFDRLYESSLVEARRAA